MYLMEVIKVSPGGYCYGMVDALQVVQQAIKDPHVPRPVHILGQIIRNRHVVEAFTALGVITLDGPGREAYDPHTAQTEALVPMRKGEKEG